MTASSSLSGALPSGALLAEATRPQLQFAALLSSLHADVPGFGNGS